MQSTASKLKLWIGKAYFDPQLFTRAGRSVDVLYCPTMRAVCHCIPKCAICKLGRHSGFHGPIYRAPVGSVPWGHEFAEHVRADDLSALLPEVDLAVQALPLEVRDDIRQDVVLSLLEFGRPLDMRDRVRAKLAKHLSVRDTLLIPSARFRLVALDEPTFDGSNETRADRLVG